jgi:hypothetical protein
MGRKTQKIGKMDSNYTLVADERGVNAILEDLGEMKGRYLGLFVKGGEYDYEEVWGFHDTFPHNGLLAYQIV